MGGARAREILCVRMRMRSLSRARLREFSPLHGNSFVCHPLSSRLQEALVSRSHSLRAPGKKGGQLPPLPPPGYATDTLRRHIEHCVPIIYADEPFSSLQKSNTKKEKGKGLILHE